MIPEMDNFLLKFSPSSVPGMKNKLKYFEEWLEKNKKKDNVLDADYSDIFEFFKEDIDKRGNKAESNRKWRNTLNSYYEYIVELFKKNKRGQFINPVPTNRFFQFDNTRDLMENEFDTKYLTYKTIEKVLRFFFFTEPKMFILMSVLAYSGARISEVTSIRLKDVDIQNRKIISGRTPGKSKSGLVIYFFPAFFTKYLTQYINDNPHLGEYLFPKEGSIKDTNFPFIQSHTVRKKLRKLKKILNIDVPINPHAFRDAINTERKEMGCPQEEREMLINQKPREINTIHYLKRFKNWREIKELYDRYFPYPEFHI